MSSAGSAILDFVFGAGLERTLRLFWHFFFLDFPRYIVSDLVLVFYLLTAARRRGPAPETDPFAGRDPLVSVIVPVLNEAPTLYRAVESLHDQTYRNIEILFLDDGSRDETPKICRELSSRFPDVRSFTLEDRSGKSAALNLGARFARGELLCFVDSDTTFDREAIARMVARLRDPAVGCVAGNIRVRNPRRNLLTELQSLEYGLTIAVGRRIQAAAGTLPIVSGAFGMFRREVVEAIGGHDPGPGNDSDLTLKVRKLGYEVAFAPDAVCLTRVPDTLGALVRQRRRWSRNLVKNRIFKHGNIFHPLYNNWRGVNLLSSLDSIFFHLILSATSVFYLLDLLVNYPSAVPFILAGNYVLYFVAESVEFLVLIGFSERKSTDLWSSLYLPLFNPYKRLHKLVRVYAYLEELLFKRSYFDRFAPAKVRERLERW